MYMNNYNNSYFRQIIFVAFMYTFTLIGYSVVNVSEHLLYYMKERQYNDATNYSDIMMKQYIRNFELA